MPTRRHPQRRKSNPTKQLNAQQKRFVEFYLLHPNATEAARLAGYSKKTAEQLGYQLSHNPLVKDAIAKAQEARAQRMEVKADDVLRELMRIAYADPGEAFNEDGTPKPLHLMPPHVRRAISGFEVDVLEEPGTTTDDGLDLPARAVARTVKLKFWDKPKTLELLGKHLKLFIEKHELSADGPFNFTINLGAAK